MFLTCLLVRPNITKVAERNISRSLENGIASQTNQQCLIQNKLEEAHIKALKYVCEIFEVKVTDRKKVVKLSDLRNEYAKILETTEFVNPDYRGKKLKTKRLKNQTNSKKRCRFAPLVMIPDSTRTSFLAGT